MLLEAKESEQGLGWREFVLQVTSSVGPLWTSQAIDYIEVLNQLASIGHHVAGGTNQGFPMLWPATRHFILDWSYACVLNLRLQQDSESWGRLLCSSVPWSQKDCLVLLLYFTSSSHAVQGPHEVVRLGPRFLQFTCFYLLVEFCQFNTNYFTLGHSHPQSKCLGCGPEIPASDPELS